MEKAKHSITSVARCACTAKIILIVKLNESRLTINITDNGRYNPAHHSHAAAAAAAANNSFHVNIFFSVAPSYPSTYIGGIVLLGIPIKILIKYLIWQSSVSASDALWTNLGGLHLVVKFISKKYSIPRIPSRLFLIHIVAWQQTLFWSPLCCSLAQ